MVFQGNLVRLRPLRKSDLQNLVAWSNDPEVDVYMDGGYPGTFPEAMKWLEDTKKDRHARRFAIETVTGTIIGDLALDHIAWRRGDAELTIRIGEKGYWGKGYGTDAVNTILTVAFEHLGLSKIYLRVYRFNERAVKTYTKCGFRREGVLRRAAREIKDWKDIILMSKTGAVHDFPLSSDGIKFA